MRKIILLGATLGLLATVSSASAQSSGSWIGSLGGGVTLPTGKFGDAVKTGWHGAATLGYKPAASKWEWLLDASYHHHVNKVPNIDASSSLWIAMGRANYWAGSNLYVLGGAGMMRDESKTKVGSVSTTGSVTALAVTGGLGYVLGKNIFLEGRLIDGFTKGASTVIVPITIGIRF